VNVKAGATSHFSNFVSAILVLLTVLFLTIAFYNLPKATLSAIIIASVLNLFDYETAIHLYKTNKWEFTVLIVTFFGVLWLGVEIGIGMGIGLSICITLLKIANPSIIELGYRINNESMVLIDMKDFLLSEESPMRFESITISKFEESILFLNIAALREYLVELCKDKVKYMQPYVIILDLSSCHQIDSSGVTALTETHHEITERGVKLFFVNVQKPVLQYIEKSGALIKIGEDNFFDTALNAIDAAKSYQNSPNNMNKMEIIVNEENPLLINQSLV